MSERKQIVYVVDDRKVISETLAIILNQAGYIAFAFQDAAQAMSAAAQASTPDLLISDVVMPGISGIELAIHFQNHYPDCKVILISGQAVTTNLLEAARAQGYEFD